MPSEINLSNLKPASPRTERKRIGRGLGSGKGRYSGRGRKGQKARAGSASMRAGFEGGQTPVHMRMAKQRGATSKDAMPIGPHRTAVYGVNVGVLEARYDAGEEVSPESLKAKGLIRSLRRDVKILGEGELAKGLTVSAHAFSKGAVEKIEAAGGTVNRLKPPHQPKKRKLRAKPAAAADEAPAAEQEPAEAPAEETPAEE